jgi:hypothetical protein
MHDMLSASRHGVSWNKPGMAGVAFTVSTVVRLLKHTVGMSE